MRPRAAPPKKSARPTSRAAAARRAARSTGAAPADSGDDCKSGLMCVSGTCESPPSCDLDFGLPRRQVRRWQVPVLGQRGDGVGPVPAELLRTFHVAQDIAIVSGNDVCSIAEQEAQNFTCYYAGTRDQPFPGRVQGRAALSRGIRTRGRTSGAERRSARLASCSSYDPARSRATSWPVSGSDTP